MLEIVILYFVYRRFSREARAKGRSGAWGWFGVAMWLSAEFLAIGFVDPSWLGSTDDPLTILKLSAVGFFFGIVGLVGAWSVMKRLQPPQSVWRAPASVQPDVPTVAPYSPTPIGGSAARRSRAVSAEEPAPVGSVFVGFCEDCDRMVWLTADQACPEHGRDTVGSIRKPL